MVPHFMQQFTVNKQAIWEVFIDNYENKAKQILVVIFFIFLHITKQFTVTQMICNPQQQNITSIYSTTGPDRTG